MPVQESVLQHLGHHTLVEAGAVQVSRLLGLQQLRHDGLGRHHEAEAKTGCQHLRKRSQVDAALGVARGQRRWRRVVKPQITIRVVFHQGQTDGGRTLHQGRAARLAHAAARGVLEVGQHIEETGAFWGQRRCVSFGRGGSFPFQVVYIDALGIAGHAHNLRLHGREGLQGPQVGGGLHQHAAAFIDQYLGHQVQALLAAGGDQHLVG